MEDGALAHRTAMTKQWHFRHGVKLFLGWPGNSFGLNPIENLWSLMKHMQRELSATSIAVLKKIALKIRRQITPAYLKKLYESMPQECMPWSMLRRDTPNPKSSRNTIYISFY